MREELEELVRRHLAAENAHDMAATLATLHEDCVFEDVATGQVFLGRSGAEAYYRQWWDAFAVTVERAPGGIRCWSDDGTFIAEARYVGRHVGPFLGIAPTGSAVDFRFVVILGFKDGLMAGERFYYDLARLLRQIGAGTLPAAATP
jgi:steroid delta-isomerase-like uncharacterized protein